MELKTIGKRLVTEPISAALTQGENGVNCMEIHTPRYLDGTDLSGYIFKIRGTSADGGLVEQVLERETGENEIILRWEVSLRFTAVAGALTLELSAISPDGAELVKFSAAEITIRETLEMPPVPSPDLFEKALNDISVLQETKLSAENLIAGNNISLTKEGKNVTIDSESIVIDDGNPSPENVYSSEKLEQEFIRRSEVGGLVQEAVDGMELPPATTTSLGCIRVGSNLSISSDGTLSALSSGSGEASGAIIDDGAVSVSTVYSSAKVEEDFAKKSDIDINKTYVDGELGKKADKVHSHAEYVTTESVSAFGDMKKSVYDKTGNGIVDNAEKVNGLTVLTAVPANAKFTDTVYGVATTAANGLCPKRTGTTTKFLRDDGTWAVPPNTTYGTATTSANGLMTAAMVTKLNGIATGANKYALPTASASVLGGIKVGSGLAISSGVLRATSGTATKLWAGNVNGGSSGTSSYTVTTPFTNFKYLVAYEEYGSTPIRVSTVIYSTLDRPFPTPGAGKFTLEYGNISLTDSKSFELSGMPANVTYWFCLCGIN